MFDKKWLAETHEKVRDSATFLSIFTDNYKEDPLALVQLVFAMMLEKPIYLIVPEGTKIPRAFLKAADKIEFFEPDNKEDMQAKVTKMLKDHMS